ncbi:MAG: phosphate/phosphite/phosphonate ABC transporter substrate-binding protein [Desulfobulbaceae bacterium]
MRQRTRRKPAQNISHHLLLGLVSLLLWWSSPGWAQTHALRIAILPCNDVVKTFERFKPLTDYIESKTGFAVQAVFPKDEEELIRIFRKHGADFLFHSPYEFSRIEDSIDPRSLLKALGPDGKDHEIGYIVVRQDSGLKTFQDLHGKKVIFGMECSAGRWRAAREVFAENGIDIEKDLDSFTDGGCCKDISFNIFLKAADAGLVCQHYFDEQKELGAAHVEALAVIGKTRPSPTRIFAAHKDTPGAITDRVMQALTAIDLRDIEYHSLTKTTEIGGFVNAAADEYR